MNLGPGRATLLPEFIHEHDAKLLTGRAAQPLPPLKGRLLQAGRMSFAQGEDEFCTECCRYVTGGCRIGSSVASMVLQYE